MTTMDYFVVGPDGTEYGPANLSALTTWAEQGRVLPSTMLKVAATGEFVVASSVEGIFPQESQRAIHPSPVVPARELGADYAAPTYKPSVDDGKSELIGSIIRSVLAIFFFFFLHGIGLVFAGYGLYYGIQAKAKGHKLGTVALGISAVTFVVVAIGWALRFMGKPIA